MGSIGIKISINDFFCCLIPGIILDICIVLAICFADNSKITFFKGINTEQFSSVSSNLFLILVLIAVTYVVGHIISALSSFIIEKIINGKIMKKLPYLRKMVNTKDIISEPVYNLVIKKAINDFGIEENKFDVNRHIRLLITSVEEHSPRSYSTAFVFLTLYGMNRNLCMIFFPMGTITLFTSIAQPKNILFASVLFLFSVLTFYGYIKYNKYFISQISSAYLNTEAGSR